MFKKLKIETPFDFMCAAAGVFFLVAGVVLMTKFTPDLMVLVVWLALLAAAFFLVRRVIRRLGWMRVGGMVAVLLIGALALWGVEEYYQRDKLVTDPELVRQLNELEAQRGFEREEKVDRK
jgi:thiol:disulfide interchange protein